MDRTRPTLNQLNIVSGNVDASIAFYRQLGVDIPDPRIWRTATGAHHVSAIEADSPDAATLDLDSAAFAQIWNKGWAGRKDLAGRVVVGFSVNSREEVDRLYGEMTAGGAACKRRSMRSGARAMPSSRIPTASPWDS
jgi:predicted lactoylglutathione lyase